jgi:hypothetical protein
VASDVGLCVLWEGPIYKEDVMTEYLRLPKRIITKLFTIGRWSHGLKYRT